MFPGSFDCNAAEAVIRARSDTGALPISILRSLKNRSLIEQPRSRRYQLHPLVRAFAKEIAKEMPEPPPLERGETLACAHFMFHVHQNSKMYWGKNTCSASIESFSNDRENFEYFLRVYADGMKKHDPEIAESCKTFLHDSLQKCMYLEMCLSPWFYVEFLESLLKSFSEGKFQRVRVVEVMCLLGHEMRKVGQKEKYKEYMEEAKTLYSEKSSEFAKNTISEVFYMNSYADLVSKQGDPANNDDVWNQSEIALKTCSEKLEVDHPERASTLLLAGRFAKRMGKRSEAEGKLKQALELFLERLGKHVRTVNALKEIGDFFLSGETEENLEKALMYYKQADQMMHEMGMENSKQNILILKNYGVCVMKRGNFAEAMEYLESALLVAERELEADHNWKVMIKTRLSLTHEKIGNVNNAKVLMKEALTMCYRLENQIKRLGVRNSRDVLEFLQRHKKDFPKAEFPR